MRRRLVWSVILSAILLASAACGSDDGNEASGGTSTTAEVVVPGGAAVGSPGTEVTTEGTSYAPARLVAKVGEAITFTNSGGSHSVTPDDPAGWSDGGAAVDAWGSPGATYETTFSEPGEYAYHCSIHGAAGGSGMAGVVIIE